MPSSETKPRSKLCQKIGCLKQNAGISRKNTLFLAEGCIQNYSRGSTKNIERSMEIIKISPGEDIFEKRDRLTEAFL